MESQQCYSQSFLLDCILSAALELRQKHQNLILLLKQSQMLSATTTINQAHLHQIIVSVVESIYLPRSKQTNPIILIYSSKQFKNVHIRFVTAPLIQPNHMQLSDHVSDQYQLKRFNSQVLLILAENSVDIQTHALPE